MTPTDLSRINMVRLTEPNFLRLSPIALFNILNEKYTNRNTFSAIIGALKKLFHERNDETSYDFWQIIGLKVSERIRDAEFDNSLEGNEIKNWKSQDQIYDILQNIDVNNITNYNRYLLLSLCLFQPPLRKDFYLTAKFLFDPKKNNGKDNYILLRKKPLRSYYIVNHDKVSKHEQFDEPKNKYIEIDDEKLVDILRSSYNQRKRSYVFESDKNEQYSPNTISKLLLERPFNLNFNILRSSYITDFYNKHRYLREREDLARKMRHSRDTSEKNYYKRPLEEDD